MGEKRDIGSFFKDKLKEGKKSPNKDLWDKINKSLDEKQPVQKNNLGYWLAGLGLPILIGLFILFTPSDDNEENLKFPERNNSVELPFSSFENENDDQNQNASTVDSLNNTYVSEGEYLKTTPTLHDSKKMEQNPPEIAAENKIEKPSPKSPSINEAFEVSKKYHYYNSEDGEK